MAGKIENTLAKLLAAAQAPEPTKKATEWVFGSWKVELWEGTNKKTGKPYSGVSVFPTTYPGYRGKPTLAQIQSIVTATLTDSDELTKALEKAQELSAAQAQPDDEEEETAEEKTARLMEKMQSRK